jgi:hypothetical protein
MPAYVIFIREMEAWRRSDPGAVPWLALQPRRSSTFSTPLLTFLLTVFGFASLSFNHSNVR